jgi:hypothetical protein
MKAATIALTVLALAVPSIGLGGSTKPPAHSPPHAAVR